MDVLGLLDSRKETLVQLAFMGQGISLFQDSNGRRSQNTSMPLSLAAVSVACPRLCCWGGQVKRFWYWNNMTRLGAAAILSLTKDMSLIQVTLGKLS